MTAAQLTPLPVAILLLTAALIAITSFAPRHVHDALATAAGAAAAALCAILLVHARHAPVVEWLGGWRPSHGVALGISLVVDQIGAGAALLVGVILTATLVYSWAYFEDLDGRVHSLMLVLAAGLIGICLTGDLFNMIVFFVVTTVAAIGLAAVEIEHSGPLQGAINLGVVNSVAGFGLLVGAALVYGRTGALNLAQIDAALVQHPIDALLAVSLAMLSLGFLTKAGVTPFHFWVPDALASSPTPASALFAGALSPVMLFGLARLLATGFAPALHAHEAGVRAVLVGVGVVTAAVGALGCFEQRHVKRMLSFAAISQTGALLCGVGLLRSTALAGAAVMAVAFGLTIAALFGAAGVLVRRYDSLDEFELSGRAHDLPLTGFVFLLGALVLVGLPPGGCFYGRWLIDTGARDAGFGWLPAVLALTSAVTAAGILRVAARVFLGWGVSEERDRAVAGDEHARAASAGEETATARSDRGPRVLAVVPLVLVAAAAIVGFVPGLLSSVQAAGAHFRDTGAYVALVLHARAPAYAASSTSGLGASAWVFALVSTVAALVIAWLGLRGRRVFPLPLVEGLRSLQSGHVGDYVAWWTFGMATIGGLVLWAVTA